MPFIGHWAAVAVSVMCATAPSTHSTGAGNREEEKNAQNQATKNITSEAMNRIMP